MLNRIKRKIQHSIWLALMSALGLITIYPLVFSTLAGLNTKEEFKSMGELFPIPKQPNYLNYTFAFSESMLRPLLNTIIRTGFKTILTLMLAILIGYALARYDFKFKKFFITFIIATRVIPGILTMIPTFVMVSNIPLVGGNDIFGNGGTGLYNNILMLYLPLGFGTLMWAFFFQNAMKGMPISFEEAAVLDGASFRQTLTKVVIPMQKPIITVIAVNTALGTWNDWETGFLYINDIKNNTLPAYISILTASLQEYDTPNYPRLFALATVVMIPPLLIFLFLQKYIVEGIASAGVKG